MTRVGTYAAFVLLFCPLLAHASTQDELKKRQQELQTIRDQIRQYETKIKQQQANEKESLDLLDTYDRKGTLLRRLIARLHADEEDLQVKTDATRKGAQVQESQLAFLKKHYASYVTSVYKSGRIHDVELLLSAASINQFYIRTEYLKRFTDQRKNDAKRILKKKLQIEDTQARLQQQLSEEQRLISEKGAEEDRLASLAADRRDVLSQIRKNKRLLQREIERQTRAAKDLEDMITQLIEEDRLKKEKEAEEAHTAKVPEPVPPSGSFEAHRGKLPWPVAEGKIVARFGIQKHPTLKTITQNTGIDILVQSGTPVVAVADGEVSKIWWLPSYGNLIIMNHYNGYRTVYTHLADISVSEGQKVNGGEEIGTSGESIDGPRLHFEVWKDRDKQNPELWLSRR